MLTSIPMALTDALNEDYAWNLCSCVPVYAYRITTPGNPLQENGQGEVKRICKGRKAMKHKRLWILLGASLLVSAAFLLLNFRVAVGNIQSLQRIMVTEMDGNYPERLQSDDKISMVLVGEGPLVRALQKALIGQMDKVGMGQIELEQELKPEYPNPVLVVKLAPPGPIWTPFFARSHFSIQAGYATNGDTTFMDGLDKTQPYIRSSDPSVVNLYSEYEVSDRSLGLISRPGYHRFLADYLAQEIVQALKNLYNIQDPTGGLSLKHRSHG
jgi:hypothetical protein